jgi:hypothetical protein
VNSGAAAGWLKAGGLLVAGLWGLLVAGRRASWGFLDGVNLILHEAGHVIFFLGGEFLTVLGGSLLQVLVPVACAAAFAWRGEAFGAGLCGIWTGQSLVGVSLYMADARARALPLLGGDDAGHDWNYLLGRLSLLAWDRALGRATALLAGLIILGSAVLAALHCLSASGGLRAED